MSKKLNELIREAIGLPVHDLGYSKEVPEGELSSFMEEEEEEEKDELSEEEEGDEEKDELDEEEEEDEDEESMDEDLSVADHQKNLPVHSLGYFDEVPDEELMSLIGGEEERDEADLDLGSDQILPSPSVNEEDEEESEDSVHESSGAEKRQRVKELKAAVAQEKKSLKPKEDYLQAAAEAAFNKGDMKAYGAVLRKQKALYSRLRSLEDQLDDVVAGIGTLRESDDEDADDAVHESSGAEKRQRVKELKAAIAQEKKSLKPKEASLQAAAEAAFDKGDMKAYGAALKKQKALYSRLRSLEDELDDVVDGIGTLRESDDEDVEDAVNEALRLLSKKTKRKSKLIREEEEEKDDLEEEEEDEESGEEDELHEDDMPGDGVYHKGGDEEGEEKREMDEEEEEETEHDEIKEGLNAIFANKKLSKAFKNKTATIFEAAVKSKVNRERAKIREAYKIATSASRKIQEDKLVNKLSDYLDYAVNEWTKQNKVALESSIKTQITEEFMGGLKSLFESKYIEVPRTKKNLLASLEKKVKTLELRLNEQTKANVELHKNLKKSKKALIIRKACEGLTDSNKERLISLTENFEFTTAKEFAEKVLTIRKSFFETKSSSSKSTNNRMTKSGIELKESFEGNEVDAYINAFRKRNL